MPKKFAYLHKVCYNVGVRILHHGSLTSTKQSICLLPASKKEYKHMIKTFEEALAFNGFKVPWTPICKLIFWRKWNAVRIAYEDFCSDYTRRVKKWEKIRTELEKEWGYSFPRLTAIEGTPTLYLRTPYDAIRSIEVMRGDFLSEDVILFERDYIAKARERWLNEILANAPEKCDLIVIRQNTYEPEKNNKILFDTHVEHHKTASIWLWGKLIWVAFSPTAPISAENLGMRRTSSKVEYITK